MRGDKSFIPELDFVMEIGGELIGQNVFARAGIKTDDGATIPVLTMGPICIAPAYKRKGYGKKLLDFCLARAKELGFGGVCICGDLWNRFSIQHELNFKELIEHFRKLRKAVN